MNFENEQVEMILLDTAERTDKTCSVLASDFASVRAGRANPHILDKILVDYYGTPTPISRSRTPAVWSSPRGTLPC